MSTYANAMAEAARQSGLDDCEIADRIGISKGYYSRLSRKAGSLWASRVVKFCQVTGSNAPIRWMAGQIGYDLVARDARAAEVAALKQRLQELERAA